MTQAGESGVKIDRETGEISSVKVVHLSPDMSASMAPAGFGADFALAPSPPQGVVPDPVLRELVTLKQIAAERAEDASMAVLVAAKNHGVRKGALSKYVAAAAADKLTALDRDTASLRTLLGAVDVDAIWQAFAPAPDVDPAAKS